MKEQHVNNAISSLRCKPVTFKVRRLSLSMRWATNTKNVRQDNDYMHFIAFKDYNTYLTMKWVHERTFIDFILQIIRKRVQFTWNELTSLKRFSPQFIHLLAAFYSNQSNFFEELFSQLNFSTKKAKTKTRRLASC